MNEPGKLFFWIIAGAIGLPCFAAGSERVAPGPPRILLEGPKLEAEPRQVQVYPPRWRGSPYWDDYEYPYNYSFPPQYDPPRYPVFPDQGYRPDEPYVPFPPELDWPYSDSEIRRNVRTQFVFDSFLNSIGIKVRVQDGVVILTGAVDTWNERRRAEINAYEAGARQVINRLTIRPY